MLAPTPRFSSSGRGTDGVPEDVVFMVRCSRFYCCAHSVDNSIRKYPEECIQKFQQICDSAAAGHLRSRAYPRARQFPSCCAILPAPTNGHGPAPKGINDRKPPSIPPASYQQFFREKLMKFTFQELRQDSPESAPSLAVRPCPRRHFGQ